MSKEIKTTFQANKEIECLEEEIVKITKNIKSIEKLKRELGQKEPITCENCKCKRKFNKFVFVQNNWYEPPKGCTEGDNWHEDDSNSYFICSKCGHENGVYGHKDKERVLANKYLFKEIWKKREDIIKKPGDENYDYF